MKFHFTFEEMFFSARAEQDGIVNVPAAGDTEVLNNLLNTMRELEKARNMFGQPIIVTSGYRTPQVNALVGGADGSQHLRGQAADITASRKGDNEELARIIRTFCDYDQLITYHNAKGQVQWVHVSFRREGVGRKEWLRKKA